MNKGFTLIEVMVAAAVGLLVIGLVLVSFITLSVSSTADARYATMHHGIRNTLDRMSRDIHSAEAVTACSALSSFTIRAVTESGTESITYLLDGDTVYRRTTTRKKPLTDKVAAMQVTMYSSDGAATLSVTEAAALEVALLVSNKVVRLDQTDALRMRATLRNK